MRRIVIAAAIFLVAVAAGVAFLLFSLDVIAERRIEQKGSELTGTRVSVDSVTLRLPKGRGAISDLRVANPEGFSDASALALDDIELVIAARSPSESPFPIEDLRVGRTRVLLEIDESGHSNLDVIRRHATEQSKRVPPPGEAEEEPVRLVIGRLHFEGGEVLLLTADRDEPQRLTLPPFTLTEVGGRDGVTGSELGLMLLRELVRRAAVASAGHELGRALEKELGEAGRAAGELIRGIFE